MVIEMARRSGRVKTAEVERPGQQTKPAPAAAPIDPLESSLTITLDGPAGSWGGYAGRQLRDVPSEILSRASDWAQDKAIEARERKMEEDAHRFDQFASRCDLIVAARGAGQLPEPPHKDGTPREQPAGKDPTASKSASSSPAAASTPGTTPTSTTAQTRPGDAPTQKQSEYFINLAEHRLITAEERKRALDWLAHSATRATIKAQIDWLKTQITARQQTNATAGRQPGED
jgi:hypothetical protein